MLTESKVPHRTTSNTSRLRNKATNHLNAYRMLMFTTLPAHRSKRKSESNNDTCFPKMDTKVTMALIMYHRGKKISLVHQTRCRANDRH
jgi:hypothetical protein